MCKSRVRQKQWSAAAGDGRFEPHPLIPWGVPASDDPHAPPMIPSPLRGEEEEFEDPYWILIGVLFEHIMGFVVGSDGSIEELECIIRVRS